MPYVSPEQALTVASDLHRGGRLDEAEGLYRQILAVRPDDPDALHLLGVVRRRRGDGAGAVALIERAVALRPDFIPAYTNFANALADVGQDDAAIAILRQGTGLAPADVGLWWALGNRLWHLDRYDEAEQAYRRVLALQPDHFDAGFNLGVSYQKLGRLDEAKAVFAAMVALAPEHAGAVNSLGNVLRDRGDPAAALPFHRRALALDPDFHEARKCLAISLLANGDLRDGFQEYEGRRLVPDGRTPQLPRPEWNGEPLAGRTVLLYCEQGLGDTIHFIRYAPLVRACGGRVVFGCQPALTRLLRSVEGIDELVPTAEVLPPFDLHLPLLSVPRVLGTTLATVPSRVPYITAEPDLVAHWGQRLGPREGCRRIGLVWAGNAQYGADRRRSLSLDRLRPLMAVPGNRFFGLQLGDGRRDLETGDLPPGFVDLASGIDDFADTAAIMANLDLVVSVDTSVAHLAGAMGRPVWILVPFASDWRWLKGRMDSPWYPTARLFRQPAPGDWTSVIVSLEMALRAIAPAR